MSRIPKNTSPISGSKGKGNESPKRELKLLSAFTALCASQKYKTNEETNKQTNKQKTRRHIHDIHGLSFVHLPKILM